MECKVDIVSCTNQCKLVGIDGDRKDIKNIAT